MKIYSNPSQETWAELSKRPQLELEFLDSSVRNVLNRVKKSGDEALHELTLQYDKVSIQELRVTDAELAEAEKSLPASLKQAIITAAANIEKFHAAQKRDVMTVDTLPGVSCWR